MVLAAPAAVWLGAGLDQVTGDCDVHCGDRDRGWFMLVLVTAPLIPLGGVLLARGARAGPLVRLGRLGCVLACSVFVLLAPALLGGAVGAFVDLVEGNYGVNLDDPEGSKREAIGDVVLYVAAALWCLAVAVLMVAVRRRLVRRYPSGSWPPSDRSTSAG